MIFSGDGKVVTWELPMLMKDDEKAIMEWVRSNKSAIEAVNTGAQLVRAICEAFSSDR